MELSDLCSGKIKALSLDVGFLAETAENASNKLVGLYEEYS
jgi:hypothetical protein